MLTSAAADIIQIAYSQTADGRSNIGLSFLKRTACEVGVGDGFDMYAELLGIEPGLRPPDYYTLIGVPSTESDAARIHAAAKRRITRLSAMLGGERAKFAQKLMGEVATARAVLTTPEVKARYDEKIRAAAIAVSQRPNSTAR